MALLFELKNIDKNYDKANVLHNISLKVHKSEILSLIGPNGAGKSTLCKIILGIEKPSSGTLLHHKHDIKFGYVPQRINKLEYFSIRVKDFIRIFSPKNKESTHYNSVIEKLKIEKLLESNIYEISGGQLQRILFAASVMNQPDVIILDEATQGIDIDNQAIIFDYINELKREHHTSFVLVSHDLNTVFEKTDRVICLNHHICCSGAPQEVDKSKINQVFAEQHMTIYKHHHDHKHTG